MSASRRFKSILVPLDGSELAERALSVGAALAGKAGASLHLVSVQEPLTSLPFAAELPATALEIQDVWRRQLSEYLTSAVFIAQAGGAPAVRSGVLDGLAAQKLAEYILTESIGLVVMTTHGRGGLKRLWLGSVADRLLRTAGVPMLLLHPGATPERTSFRRVLVALDGDIEQEVVDAALGILELMPEAALMLTRVVEPPIPGLTRLAVQPAPFGSDWTERHEVEARSYLARLAERLRSPGRSIDTQVLVGRPVPDQLLALAHAIGADLVVLGTHGARGVERVLLGSVADKVIRMSDLPLLVAPVHHQAGGHLIPGGPKPAAPGC